MGKTIRVTTGNLAVAAGNTFYISLAGTGNSNATEDAVSIPCRPAGTFTKLLSVVSANTLSVTATVTLRKNSANVNNTVSILTTQTGSFEDASSSDSFTDGDTVSLGQVSPAGTGSITYRTHSVIFDADTNCRTQLSNNGSQSLASNSTTRYTTLNSLRDASTMAITTESTTQTLFKSACTLKNLSCRVNSNGRSTTSTVRTRKNAGNGSQSISVTSGATGAFEDTTNSDSIAVDDLANYSLSTSTGGGTITFSRFSVTVESTTNTTYLVTGNAAAATIAFGITRYLALADLNSADTTESIVAFKTRLAGNLKNLTLNVSGNTVNGSSTFRLRKSTASAAVSLSVGSSATGTFSDTSNTESVADTDTINLQIVTGGSSGSISLRTSNADFFTSTLFERGITEGSISVSDTNARLLTANRALPESSISVSDANARLLTAMRPISESSISVNDSNDRLRTAFAAIEEDEIEVSAGDLERLRTAPVTINEAAITVGDSLTKLLTAFRTISEPSISVSETVTGNLFIETSIDEDPIIVSDSLARLLIAQRSIEEDEIDVSETLDRIKTIIRLIDEDVDVSDDLTRIAIRVRSISEDPIDVDDTLTRLLIAVRTIDEDVDVSDALARMLTAFRTISESSISVSDALARTVVFPRPISEPSISVSDALARIGYYNRAIPESSISVSDALARILIIVREIAEDVDVSDSLARLLIANRSLADTITVSDAVAQQLIFLREIDEDPISVSDSVDLDETKLAAIFEPAITVGDSLVRRLSAFRTIAEDVDVSDDLTGLLPIPVLAEYITDPGYTNPLRFRVTFKSRLHDTLADESGDQIIYYQYDSFVPEARPFNITDFSMRLTQGEISTASLTIEDHKGLIADTRKIGFKSIVEVDFKKELGRSWERILTGFVRRVRTLRPAYRAISYNVTILSKQIVDSERIINFKRAAKRSSVDSTDALTTDANMATNKLFKEIYESINHFPRKNSPAVKDTGEYDLETGSISDEVTDFITEIAPGLTTVAETTNQLTEGIGAIKGVDEFGNPYLRYPTEKHSGIIIKDSPLNIDSALNTSVNMSSFEFEDTIDIAEGFANRLYVLNSKEAKSIASSSKTTGFTSLTTRWIAQSFIADDNNINSAAFILSKTGNPTNTTGTIKGLLRASSSNGNFPTGATLATFEISLSSLTNAKDTIFVNDIQTKAGVITVGQKYWWVLQGTGLVDNTHTVNWHHDNDLATAGRPRSAILPQVDTDPTQPGSQFNWISTAIGVVYAFSTFSSINHVLVQSDPESIAENGLIEAVVNLPAFSDDATYQKVLVKIIRDSAKVKRIFDYTRVTIPTAKLFKPGELVTVVDSKANLDIEKVINAEIAEVSYNFDVNANALGCKYCDLRLVGFVDTITNDYLETKEC